MSHFRKLKECLEDLGYNGLCHKNKVQAAITEISEDMPEGSSVTATSAELEDVGNAINTYKKFVGKSVYNTTTKKMVCCSDAAAGGIWVDTAGVNTHTPV